jgi:hypothetical protein
MADQDAGEQVAESEWRFPLEEFEEGTPPDSDGAAGDDGGRDEATDPTDPAGPQRIERGDPTLEGAVFVLLGVAFALFVISRLVVG